MLSATIVAAENGEPPYHFYTQSRFETKNKLRTSRSRTLVYDLEKRSKPLKTKGDTSIIDVIFSNDGTISEKMIVQKKEID